MSANSSLEAALATAIEELTGASIPYMLIGGLALSAWALPRATLDIDLTLWVSADDLDRVCAHLCSRYTSRVADPNNFVHKTRVLPVVTDGGVRLDFLFAAFPFEQRMIHHAPLRDVGSVAVRVVSLEDLILLKLPSPRPRDQEDVRVIPIRTASNGTTCSASEIYWRKHSTSLRLPRIYESMSRPRPRRVESI